MNKLVCIDVETTGLNPGVNRIIQLSAIKFDPSNWEVLGEFDEYINPTGVGTLPLIERSAQDIHHITPEFLSIRLINGSSFFSANALFGTARRLSKMPFFFSTDNSCSNSLSPKASII